MGIDMYMWHDDELASSTVADEAVTMDVSKDLHSDIEAMAVSRTPVIVSSTSLPPALAVQLFLW